MIDVPSWQQRTETDNATPKDKIDEIILDKTRWDNPSLLGLTNSFHLKEPMVTIYNIQNKEDFNELNNRLRSQNGTGITHNNGFVWVEKAVLEAARQNIINPPGRALP